VFIGIDGCPTGWIAIAITAGGFGEARAFSRFADVMTHYASAEAIAVDMPLGLVDGAARHADQAARDFLAGQSSSVFNAPPRSVLAAKDYDDAQAISRRVIGKGISRQSFAILPKIIEVDAYVGDPRVHEVHPEVSFRILNDGQKLPHRKKTWGGHEARLSLLESVGIVLPADLGPANDVGIDDVVDAAVAAWSARRIASNEARSFPAQPSQRDRCGRLIAMWG
jgi:predicted RNase H-like nuclease